MGKVFTITEGLENMGALKTGGQGSVYKARRLGELITAVKLLPTPIHSESPDDKNFIDFQNEVQKLKKVNEAPNPNVVKILSSGITDTGNLPFIEMEYIEGPDVEELLKPPHGPVFLVKEIHKAAEHLSHALAHCHQVGVKHGDIKSNNVKFNIHTGNYVLLDFGLALMSDEQRRTSLRHAGAIEFMAPEQNEGKMLFQTDIYAFGVILFELLAGQVPFPLADKGETARNAVMVSHMEANPPDLLLLRQKNIPASWSAQKREHEMNIPEWLIGMIYKCLEKVPEKRFEDGATLYEYIILNSTLAAKKEEKGAAVNSLLQQEKEKLSTEKEGLQKLVLDYQHASEEKEQELEELRAIVIHKDSELQQLKQKTNSYTPHKVQSGISKSAFYSLLLITALLAAFAGYSIFLGKWNRNKIASTMASPVRMDTQSFEKEKPVEESSNPKIEEDEPGKKDTVKKKTEPLIISTPPADDNKKLPEPEIRDTAAPVTDESDAAPAEGETSLGEYKVISRAYFHNEPDETTRRTAFIIHWNDATLQALDDKRGFIYVVFTNHLGQTSKGWLRKKDLNRIDE